MDDKDIIRAIKNVEGWLSDKEALLLLKLARSLTGRGVIVEIGSWKGKSTICLAKGSQMGMKSLVYAIDPHVGSEENRKSDQPVRTFEDFKRNIAQFGVSEYVEPIVDFSEKVGQQWKIPIELLFIDGDHHESAVRKDMEIFYPYVIEGGWIVMHDTTSVWNSPLIGWEGPRRVSHHYLYDSSQIGQMYLTDSISAGQKIKQANNRQTLAKMILRIKKIPSDILSVIMHLRLPEPILSIIRKILR